MTKPLSFPVAQPQHTLRDWFATQVNIGGEGLSINLAKAVMGEPLPSWGDDPLAHIAQAEEVEHG